MEPDYVIMLMDRESTFLLRLRLEGEDVCMEDREESQQPLNVQNSFEWCFECNDTVDNDNNLYHQSLSLEDTWRTNNWLICALIFSFSVAEMIMYSTPKHGVYHECIEIPTQI